MLRALRVVRVVRFLGVIKGFPELVVLVQGLGLAFRSITTVLGLLFLVVFMGSIVCRELLRDTPMGKNKFSTIPQSLGTVLMNCSLSRGVTFIPKVWEEHEWCACFLVLYMSVANLTILGTISGILVTTVDTVINLQREQQTVEKLQKDLGELWDSATEDNPDPNATITEWQFWDLVGRDAGRLAAMGIDVEALVDIGDFTFSHHGGAVNAQQFKRLLLDVRVNNAALVKEHKATRQYIFRLLRRSGIVDEGLVREKKELRERFAILS